MSTLLRIWCVTFADTRRVWLCWQWGVLSEHRWLFSVARRESLSFAASKYSAVANAVRQQRENHAGAKGNGDAVELGLDFERDLESMAHNLRFCVP
jgi:hypothetical protein